MHRNDISALLIALGVTAAMIWGMVYFVRHIWPYLPPWLSMLIFIFLAVMVIGYPIFELARWSDRYLKRQQELKRGSIPPQDRKQ
ncbi:MAG: hypothetical protein U1F76_27405 [Candidatus Competibacteraceae bacterium]